MNEKKWTDLGKYKEQFKFSMIATFVMVFCVHGYRILNLLNSHDSMNIVQDDVYWQRSLGRFMQTAVMVLRGSICAPWVIGLCAAVFMGLSVFIMSIILRIRERIILFMLAGVMVGNVIITSSYAAYLSWVDVYAIALFLSLLGVLCCAQKSIFINACGCVCMALSMGFYQAYICVAVGMMMILSLVVLQEEAKWKEAFKKIVRFVLCLIISGGVYYLLYQLVCKMHHVTLSNSYNGLVSVSDFSTVSIGQLIIGAYREFFAFLRYPNTFASIILLNVKVMDALEVLLFGTNILVGITIVLGVIRYNLLKRVKWWNWVLQALIILLFPLGVNFVYVISKGMEHTLMIYAFILFYVLAIVVVKQNATILPKKNELNIYGCMVAIPILLTVWNSFIFSNQIYYKLQLQQEAVQSTMTRILYEIEHMDGYEYGVTPVAFVGYLNASENVLYPSYFNEIEVLGVGKSPIRYDGNDLSYMKFYLNNKINIINIVVTEEIIQMPCYPSRGSITEIDGVIVVKLSN